MERSDGREGWFVDELLDLMIRATKRSSEQGSVEFHAFELWDAETGELLAVTAGYGLGSAYHDCSMATLVRDGRSAGQVLSKTVAHLLQSCGYGIWYWGYKTAYMEDYDAFGGRNIGRDEFFDRWDRLAVTTPAMTLGSAIMAGNMALVQPLRA